MWSYVHRNLWRRKRRTFFTAASIGFGLWLAILYIGTREDGYERFIQISSKSGFGSVTLAAPNFSRSASEFMPVVVDESLRQRLTAEPEVVTLLPRIMGDAVVNVGLANTGAAFLGVDPAIDKDQFNYFAERIVEGKWLSASDSNEVVIGKLMAQRLGVRVGDEIIYTTANLERTPVAQMASVVGIFATGGEDLDAHFFVLPLKTLGRNLNYGDNEASFVAIYFKNPHHIDSTYERLQSSWPDTKTRLYHWSETQSDLAMVLKVDRFIYRTMLSFIGIIIASGVFSCLIMNVMERRRELGTMLTLGCSPAYIFFAVMLESILLTGFGIVLGMVMVAPFYYYFSRYGVDLTRFVGGGMNVGGVVRDSFVIYCNITSESAILIFSFLFILAVSVSCYPAAKAALTVPIKTIRES